MKKILTETTPRILLGLLFLIGAIDGFIFIFTGSRVLNPPTSDIGHDFEHALQSVGFFWPFMKSIELIGAICLLTNRAPALGLALLMPIMAVVVLFHVFLNPQGLPLAAIVIVLGAVLLYSYQNNFKSLLHTIKSSEV